jgi:hypothetical protein
MVTRDGTPVAEGTQSLIKPVEIDVAAVALPELVGDLRGTKPKPERLVLEVEDAHDPPVRVGALADRVGEDSVRAETLVARIRIRIRIRRPGCGPLLVRGSEKPGQLETCIEQRGWQLRRHTATVPW